MPALSSLVAMLAGEVGPRGSTAATSIAFLTLDAQRRS
jgi:hypothetical protein